jgi:hypothetical protein
MAEASFRACMCLQQNASICSNHRRSMEIGQADVQRLAAVCRDCEKNKVTRNVTAQRTRQAGAASNSSRCRIPALGVAFPRECRFSVRRECRSELAEGPAAFGRDTSFVAASVVAIPFGSVPRARLGSTLLSSRSPPSGGEPIVYQNFPVVFMLEPLILNTQFASSLIID